ncbi:Low temperature and salt responsive protein family [Euphorbia peplus]|nr:Low temperature and salt responsive protein family [Euphorbia peplus]
MPSRCAICCEILIAILIPPLGVCLRHGCCTVEFLICLLLTILGYLPGIIYAIYAIVFVNRDDFFDEYRRPLYYSPSYY